MFFNWLAKNLTGEPMDAGQVVNPVDKIQVEELVRLCISCLSAAGTDRRAGVSAFEAELRAQGFPIAQHKEQLQDIIRSCAHELDLVAQSAPATPPAAGAGRRRPAPVPPGRQPLSQPVNQPVSQPAPMPSEELTPRTSAMPTPEASPAMPEAMPELQFSSEVRADPNLTAVGAAIVHSYRSQDSKMALELAGVKRDHRYNRFLFRKPPSIGFKALQANLTDVLSHAGNNLDPTQKPLFYPKPNGHFEIAILRDPSEWDAVQLISSLPNWEEVSPVLGSSTPDRYLKMVNRFHETSPLGPDSRIKLPFGVDLDGNPFCVDLTSNFLMLGNPESGKSVGLRTIIDCVSLLYKPELFRFLSLWDLKDGLTLKRFENLAWTGEVFDSPDPDAIRDVFNLQKEEKQRRGKLFASADVENLMEFNGLTPAERGRAMASLSAGTRQELFSFNQLQTAEQYIPWGYNLIDEIIPMVRELGPDDFNGMIGEAKREWRASGLLWGMTTQYARADLGLDPSARVDGCVIVFNCSEQAAKLVLAGEDSSWLKMATQLPGCGSCLVKQGGRITPVQTYFMDRVAQKGLVEQVLRPWSQRYIAQHLQFSGSAPAGMFEFPAVVEPELPQQANSQARLQQSGRVAQLASQPAPQPVSQPVPQAAPQPAGKAAVAKAATKPVAPPAASAPASPDSEAEQYRELYDRLKVAQQLKGDSFSLTAAVIAVTNRETASGNWVKGVKVLEQVLKHHDPDLFEELQSKAQAKAQEKQRAKAEAQKGDGKQAESQGEF